MVSKIKKSDLDAMIADGLIVDDRPPKPVVPKQTQAPEVKVDLSDVAKANVMVAEAMQGMSAQQIAATQQLMTTITTAMENMKPAKPWQELELAVTGRDRNDYIKSARIKRVE